ncbi:MAG: VOC family protein [Rhodocyclaceae bacterium]|nr:VOC family protein [Rhodocyclaceae bacterium]
MPHPIAYLAFNGNCADAMRFYETALESKLQTLLTTGESPMAAMCPPDTLNNILHACLVLPGGGMLMAGDCPASMPYEGIKGVSLTLNYDTIAEAERAFAALAEGGKVTMPMQPAFWSKAWGMLVDKFGTSWIVNGELIPI